MQVSSSFFQKNKKLLYFLKKALKSVSIRQSYIFTSCMVANTQILNKFSHHCTHNIQIYAILRNAIFDA